jgi:hypothetical protein
MRREIRLTFAVAAADVSEARFIADEDYVLVKVERRFRVASTSGTLMLERTGDGTAPGSGTNMLASTMALSGTANTKTAGALHATLANTRLPRGQSLNFVIAGTMTNLLGAVVTVVLRRMSGLGPAGNQ